MTDKQFNLYYELIYKYNFYRGKWIYSIFEFYKIKKFLKRIDGDVWVVYDVSCSPPTYGDFLMVLMLARFFMTCEIKTHFIITRDRYRSDWKSLSSDEIQLLIEDYLKISKLLLNRDCADVAILPESEFEKKIESVCSGRGHVAFGERVKGREQFYNLCIHLESKLLDRVSDKLLSNYLLSGDEASTWDSAIYCKHRYITWHLRRSLKWGFHRNMTDEDFLTIFNYLKVKYPNHEIMIVSDENGCKYFRELAKNTDLNCIFSKDYSKTFIGDCSLILRGDYHFMLNGGGISLISMFSRMPYDYIYVHNEEPWKRRKMTSWSGELQCVYPLYGRDKRVTPN
jgi:hypothetical protein